MHYGLFIVPTSDNKIPFAGFVTVDSSLGLFLGPNRPGAEILHQLAVSALYHYLLLTGRYGPLPIPCINHFRSIPRSSCTYALLSRFRFVSLIVDQNRDGRQRRHVLTSEIRTEILGCVSISSSSTY
jgi:hypothetical protein